MEMIKVGGEAFHVAVDGPETAPVLMLSNSLCTNLSMWDPQIPAFSERFKVVRYDQRGHGRTEAFEGPYSMDQLARDAVGILDALNIKRAHFCGLSMGGMTAMRLMTRHPDRLDQVILANTAAKMGPPELWNSRIRTSREGMEALADATIERWLTRDFRSTSPEAVAWVRQMIVTTPAQGYRGCCAAIRDMDQREAIRAVQHPTLVIIGAHDPATTPKAGEMIHAAIRGSRCVSLDAAHLSNVERPDAFARAVLDFLP